jgi:hypothetical protein
MALVSFKKYIPLLFLSSRETSILFPFPTSPQYFLFICDPFADPIISLHCRDISLFDTIWCIYIWMGLIFSPSENMNVVFSNFSGIHVTKCYWSAPLPTVLTVHHFKKMQLNFLSGVKNIEQIATLLCVVRLFVITARTVCL